MASGDIPSRELKLIFVFPIRQGQCFGVGAEGWAVCL